MGDSIMPDFVKHSNGEMDWSKLFMGLAMAIVLIIQQFQTYHIADLKAQKEISDAKFITRIAVEKRLDHMDEEFMKKSELLDHLNRLELSHGILKESK